MRMGGKPAPFGIDEEQLDRVLDQILALPRLDITGVHIFTGTQILDHEILTEQYRKAAELARRVARRTPVGPPTTASTSWPTLRLFVSTFRSSPAKRSERFTFAGRAGSAPSSSGHGCWSRPKIGMQRSSLMR